MLKFKKETEFRKTEIGDVPRDWEVEKLGNLATIKTGKTDVKDAVEDGEYPLFDRSAKVKRSNKYLFDKEAVIVPGEGKDFFPRYYNGKFDLHQRTYAIFDFKNLNAKYLYFAMHILRHWLSEMAVGSTVSSLRLPIFKELNIPYPPLPEQTRIAAVLSWFDDLIENKKRQNEILEKTAMALFKSWFVDFEPFKNGEFVYNEELGKKIPKGWEVKAIGEVAEFVKGLSYKGSEKFYEKPNEEAFVFITLDNVLRKGGFKTEYTWIITSRLKERHFLKNEDLVIANTDMTQSAEVIGSPAIVTFPYDYKKDRGVYSHHITRVILEHPLLKWYTYLSLKDTQEENTTFSTGTNVLGLDISNFKQNKFVLLPPQPILQRFHSLVEPLFEKIILNQKEIMILRKVRDALLPQLVFGKLRVVEL